MKLGVLSSKNFEDNRKIKEFMFMLKNKQKQHDIHIVSRGITVGEKEIKKIALSSGYQYTEIPPYYNDWNIYCINQGYRYGKEYNFKHLLFSENDFVNDVDNIILFLDKTQDDVAINRIVKLANKKNKEIIIII